MKYISTNKNIQPGIKSVRTEHLQFTNSCMAIKKKNYEPKQHHNRRLNHHL